MTTVGSGPEVALVWEDSRLEEDFFLRQGKFLRVELEAGSVRKGIGSERWKGVGCGLRLQWCG